MIAAIYARRTSDMMTRWWTIAVTLCTLLALATPAIAACAWVLWFHVVVHPVKSDSWSYQEAYSTAPQCTAELKASAKRYADGLGGEVSGNFASMMTADGKPIVVQYHCLPDTVDPRGPKGVK